MMTTINSDTLYSFLEELSANNNRQWWAENKSRYDAIRSWWLGEINKLIACMSEYEPSLRGVEASRCCYRIYRDTRFSPDKTPYKTYFSALISPAGRHFDGACYYFHQGIDENALYGGLWCPEPKVLKKVRKAIIDNVEEFREVAENAAVVEEFPEWWGHKLKTAPKGYDRNHPDIDLLRLTEYGRCHELTRDFFRHDNWQAEAARLFALLKPMNDFLNYSINEDI